MIVTAQNIITRPRRIVFDGNSLMEFATGNQRQSYRASTTCMSAVNAVHPYVKHLNLSLGSTRTDYLASIIPTAIAPNIKNGDIVVLWEICNSQHDHTEDTDGSIVYNQVLTYANSIRALGAKIVVCCAVARDHATDDANITARIFATNDLIRTNSTNFDGIVSLDALAQFNDKTKCGNGTYYNADKCHLTTAGYDLCGNAMATTLLTLL